MVLNVKYVFVIPYQELQPMCHVVKRLVIMQLRLFGQSEVHYIS